MRSGNWYGNDTIWRTVLDLYKCWIFGDGEGRLHESSQRRFLGIVDGIIAGEGNGPLSPTARGAGVVLAGLDPFAVDWAAATLLGFDPQRVKILTQASQTRRVTLWSGRPDRIQCVSNVKSWNGSPDSLTECLDFEPHFGWKGGLERPSRRRTTRDATAITHP